MVYASDRLFGRPGAMMVFLSSRVARIVPLYWIMTSVMLAYVVARGFGPSDASPLHALASYFFIPYPRPSGPVDPLYGVGWTLNYEMFFYVTFAFALLARREMAIAGIAIFFIGLVITNMAYPLPLPLSHWADPVILEFVFGMIVALLYRAGFSLPLPVATVLVIAALVEIGWTLTPWHRELPRWIIAGIPACQVVAAVVLVRQSVVTLPWLARLGDASYALYLIHPAVISVARALFSRGYLDPTGRPSPYVAGIVIASICLAFVVHRAIEKPSTAAVKRLMKSRRRAPERPEHQHIS